MAANQSVSGSLVAWKIVPAVGDVCFLHRCLIELDENLMRAELTAFDRARSLARRKELYERIHPETRQDGDHRSQAYLDSIKSQTLRLDPDTAHKTNPQTLQPDPDAANETSPQTLQPDPQTQGRPPSFVDDTATSTPWSPPTIQRAVRIATNIVPKLQEVLVATPIAQREGDLYQLAGMPDADQRQVLARIQETETPPKRPFRRPSRHASTCSVCHQARSPETPLVQRIGSGTTRVPLPGSTGMKTNEPIHALSRDPACKACPFLHANWVVSLL